MSPIVSVIIPVYKTEKYLKKCVASVLNQTYSDIQVILVDDGSPDNCPSICDEYVKKDNRCCAIHKENGGVSSARNAGLDIATGKYVCFVDSDDYLPPDSVEILHNMIQDKNVQYVAGVSSKFGRKKNISKNDLLGVIDIWNAPEKLLQYIAMPGSYSPYAKIYDLDIFRDNNIRFNQELKCSEDALMIRQYLKYCKRIALIPNNVYEYNSENEHSLSKKAYPDFAFYFSKKMQALDDLTDVLPLTLNEKKQFLVQRAVHGFKISVNHYFSHWKSEDDRKFFVNKSADLLHKWLFISCVDKSFYLYRWWNKIRPHYKTKHDLFFELIQKEYIKDNISSNIKKYIKKLISKFK